jgi:hypothetical protein
MIALSLKISGKYANNKPEALDHLLRGKRSSFMKCTHCGQPMGTRVCPSCQGETLQESTFCHRCGVRLESVAPPAENVSAADPEDDFSKRILCSDGTCIGVINEQGFCKVCGKRYEGSR